MEKQGALEFLQDRLSLPINVAHNRIFMKQWKKLSDKYYSSYYFYTHRRVRVNPPGSRPKLVHRNIGYWPTKLHALAYRVTLNVID